MSTGVPSGKLPKDSLLTAILGPPSPAAVPPVAASFLQAGPASPRARTSAARVMLRAEILMIASSRGTRSLISQSARFFNPPGTFDPRPSVWYLDGKVMVGQTLKHYRIET